MTKTRQTHKGRGATLNPEGRFERQTRTDFDDGWLGEADPPSQPQTQLIEEGARSIITRNRSPDISFSQSINPYRGCEHGCVYCMSGDTQILMVDGRTRALADIRAGDEIFGTVREGWYRRYTKSRVLAHWQVIKPAFRVTLEDGTTLVTGPDHRFLTQRGWKFVADAPPGLQRPHLTTANKLMGTGAFGPGPSNDQDYRRGYLTGMIRGDGQLGEYHYTHRGRADHQYQFHLALCDIEGLERAATFLNQAGIETREFAFLEATTNRRAMQAIRTSSRVRVQAIRDLIVWPAAPSSQWCAGFLAGIFDAEGSYSQGVFRISNTDPEIISWTRRCLTAFGFNSVIENVSRDRAKPIHVVRLLGGLRQHLRFFHCTDPAITRKRDIAGQAVKGSAKLKVVEIVPLGKAMPLYDITTETEDFIANGVISHNCYARPAHAYVNLSPGLDFETKILFKPNAPELLERELRKPGYRCESIALGTNTDPYQPAERKLKITRSLLQVMQRFRQPFSIVTKGAALMERDLDILSEMGRAHLAMVAISVTSLDDAIKRTLEPRTASPASRLRLIRRLRDAGVPVMVLVAPVIPFITDSELEAILEQAHAAGAQAAGYVMLRLPWEVKDLFEDWLKAHFPLKARHVMSLVRQYRGGGAEYGQDEGPPEMDEYSQESTPEATVAAPTPYRKNPYYSAKWGERQRGTGAYADLIEQRFRLTCRRLGLNGWSALRLDSTQFRPPPEPGDQLGLGLQGPAAG